MSSILEQAKNFQATNPGRKGVPVVQLAQKNTSDLNGFVKMALSKENRWMIQEEEQESIASVFQEVAKINAELSSRCRSTAQFHQQAGLYIGMAERIQQLGYCIHLGLDYGFYLIEHRGLEIATAIGLSWKRMQALQKGTKKGVWTDLPVKAPMSSEAQAGLNTLFEKATPLSKALLQDSEIKDFNCTLSIEKVQKVAQFFQCAQGMYDWEEKGLQEVLRTGIPKKEAVPSLEKIASLLKDLDKKARRFDPNMKNALLGESVEMNKEAHVDIQFKMRGLYIPILPYSFMQERLDLLNQLCDSSKEVGIPQFREKITLEAKYLQFFIQTLTIIATTLRQVNSILHNLALSFGKIYRNASPRTISSFFLKRALTTVHALLSKGIRVAESRKQVALQIQQMVDKTGMFHKNIAQGLLSALEKMGEGQEEIAAYDAKLLQYLKTLEDDLSPRDTYDLLQVAYEERVSLSSASAAFDSVVHAFNPFVVVLKQVFATHAQMLAIYGKTNNAEMLYEASRRLITTVATPNATILKKTETHIDELNWFIDDVLIAGIQEEFRYVQEIQHIFEPVNARVKQKNIEKAQQEGRDKERETRRAAAKVAAAKAAKEAPKQQQSGLGAIKPKKAAGGAHDPYIPQKMEKLKKCCKELGTEQAKMALMILKKPHMFSSYLDKAAREFDPAGEASESMFENEMMQSETTNDFLLAFGKMKILSHGYLNNHSSRYPYDEKTKKFQIPPKGEKFIQMAPKSLKKPQDAMAIFLDVILGLDDPNALARALSPQALEILRTDFMLETADRNKIQSALIA